MLYENAPLKSTGALGRWDDPEKTVFAVLVPGPGQPWRSPALPGASDPPADTPASRRCVLRAVGHDSGRVQSAPHPRAGLQSAVLLDPGRRRKRPC